MGKVVERDPKDSSYWGENYAIFLKIHTNFALQVSIAHCVRDFFSVKRSYKTTKISSRCQKLIAMVEGEAIVRAKGVPTPKIYLCL